MLEYQRCPGDQFCILILDTECAPTADSWEGCEPTIKCEKNKTILSGIKIAIVQHPSLDRIAVKVINVKMTKLGTFVKICLLAAMVALLLLQREESLFSSMQPTTQAKEGRESISKLGSMQSITSTATATVRTTGLDLHPEHLKGKCVAVRFKGSSATLSVDDAIEYMKAEKYIRRGTSKPLSVGLLFMDKPGGFVSLGKGGRTYTIIIIFFFDNESFARVPVNSCPLDLYTNDIQIRNVWRRWWYQLFNFRSHFASNIIFVVVVLL
jgi:hypothetical protein